MKKILKRGDIVLHWYKYGDNEPKWSTDFPGLVIMADDLLILFCRPNWPTSFMVYTYKRFNDDEGLGNKYKVIRKNKTIYQTK